MSLQIYKVMQRQIILRNDKLLRTREVGWTQHSGNPILIRSMVAFKCEQYGKAIKSTEPFRFFFLLQPFF